MADGFDSQQAGRSSFAFNPSAPAQSRAAGSGQSRGVGVQGGNIQGGYTPQGPQTQAGPGEGIPAFLGDLMQPYIERKQQESFFKGLTDAQAGKSLDEIHHSDRALSSIFGPSGYEEGAAYYTSKKALDDWNSNALSDIDNLKRLSPDDLSKVLAEKSRSLMTGNPSADQLIQKGLVEATGPLLNTVTKARYAWQQNEALTAKAGAADSAAGVFQQTMVAQAGLTAPTDADRTTRDQAISNFAQVYQRDPSMSDETYKKFIGHSAENLLASGNFYGYEVLRGKGLLKSGGPLDDDQIAKLDGKYITAANHAHAQASMQFLPDLIALDLKTRDETARDPQGAIVDFAKGAAAINGKMAAATGIDEPFLTTEDIRRGAGTLTGTLLEAYHRREARQQSIADHARDRSEKLADEAAARAQTAAEAHAAWGAGDASGAILGGMKKDDIDTLARNDWLEGNVKNIVRQFNLTGYGAAPVAALAQAGITASLGQGYTKDFDKTYQQWKMLNDASPGAARKYYNTHYVAMQHFDMMERAGIKPELAWQKSFGDPAQYGSGNAPPNIRKEVEATLPTAIGKTEAWSIMGHGYMNPWAQTRLNASSTAFLTGRLRNQVALEAGNSDQPVQALVNGSLTHMLGSGAVERSGAFVWGNQPGNKKLPDMVGAKPGEFDSVFHDVLDGKLRQDGFSSGADGDNYTILRMRDSGGKATMYVLATDENGDNPHDVMITSDELKHEFDQRRSGEVRSQQPSAEMFAARAAAKAGLDPNRKVPGETSWQHLVRVNREIKAKWESEPRMFGK